ncbi:MAG: DsbA family protein [Rhodospirillales bacterium]|nr:DsbA family protein [Rhodospirillales bacterium]
MIVGRFLVAFAATAMLITAGPTGAQDAQTLTETAKIEQIIHDYLLQHPEVVIEAINKYQTQQAQAAAEQQAKALVERRDELTTDPDAPVLGNPKGDVTLVEFFDYRCPYCKGVTAGLMDTIKSDGNVRLVMKEFPILGAESEYAAKAALAANRQGKYGEFHEAMMTSKGKVTIDDVKRIAGEVGVDTAKMESDMQAPEIAGMIQRNYDLAQALGITGTPSFVIGDQLIRGAIGMEQLKKRIAAARQR